MHTVRLRHGEFKAQMPTKPGRRAGLCDQKHLSSQEAAVYLGAMTEWLSFFFGLFNALIDVPCQHFQGHGAASQDPVMELLDIELLSKLFPCLLAATPGFHRCPFCRQEPGQACPWCIANNSVLI